MLIEIKTGGKGEQVKDSRVISLIDVEAAVPQDHNGERNGRNQE